MNPESDTEIWVELESLVHAQDGEALHDYIEAVPPTDLARAISRMPEEHQAELLTLLTPEHAADLLEELSDAQGIDILGDIAVESVAAIVDEMESDERADLLSEMGSTNAEAVLDRMNPEDAAEARELLEHDHDTAGGIMIKEYLAFPDSMTVGDVLADFRKNAEEYRDYRIQYAYVVSENDNLVGVIVLHSLLVAPESKPIREIMIANPISVPVDMDVEDIVLIFDRYSFTGLPVTDETGKLIGVVRRGDAEEVNYEETERQFMRFSGIIGGQELRSMPLGSRSANRLAWLTVNLVLSIVAALVIVLFQDTIDKVIALAALIPVLANVSGCSGNQAIAVTIRELALGLVRPGDVALVVAKEAGVGVINGIALGLLLGAVTYLWKQDVYLAFVVAFALALNTLLAVVLGGAIPLVLRRMNIDPAVAAAPMLTTIVDMCGFFVILSMAAMLLT